MENNDAQYDKETKVIDQCVTLNISESDNDNLCSK
jgi:hypothetical protein